MVDHLLPIQMLYVQKLKRVSRYQTPAKRWSPRDQEQTVEVLESNSTAAVPSMEID